MTLYRAAKRTGRTLVVDLYTAEVMEMLAEHGRLPRPGWENLKVVITSGFQRLYRHKDRGAFVDRMAEVGIGAKALSQDRHRWVSMIRPLLSRDYQRKKVVPDPEDVWSWSMWQGYLNDGDGKKLQDWFRAGGTPAHHLHTSGHASAEDLRAFVGAVNPGWLVPVHSTLR